MNDRIIVILKKLLYATLSISVSVFFYFLTITMFLPFMDNLKIRKSTDIIGVTVGTYVSYKLVKSIISMHNTMKQRRK